MKCLVMGLLELAIGECESIVLSRVFCPGVDNEILKIEAGNFRIVEHAPTRGTVASADPLVVVNGIEKLRRPVPIDSVLYGDKNWPFFRRRLCKHNQWFRTSRLGPGSGRRAANGSTKQAAIPKLENSSAVFLLISSLLK
jgi:hypothetical protein